MNYKQLMGYYNIKNYGKAVYANKEAADMGLEQFKIIIKEGRYLPD